MVDGEAEDCLPGARGGASITAIRGSEGVLGPMLEWGGAEAVVLRPERYVLAYLPRCMSTEGLASKLKTSLAPHLNS